MTLDILAVRENVFDVYENAGTEVRRIGSVFRLADGGWYWNDKFQLTHGPYLSMKSAAEALAKY